MFKRYNIEGLKKAINDPKKIGREIKIIASQVSLRLQKAHFKREYGTGWKIMQDDWDRLIILDACRYDLFSEVNWIDGNLESRISKGSHSIEFAEHNFANEDYYDTVYITANAHAARIGQGHFHDIIFTERDDGDGSWASRYGMHPETVYNSAVDTVGKYPNKRHIVHFMQPHSPYFGEKAVNIREKIEKEGIDDLGSSQWENGPNLKLALQDGLITFPELKEVYVENLELVLEYVEELCEILPGKVVITADHGELLGERDGLWKYSDLKRQSPDGIPVGHPQNVFLPELRKVPYLVIESDERTIVEAEPPQSNRKIEEQKIEQRLTALGYR